MIVIWNVHIIIISQTGLSIPNQLYLENSFHIHTPPSVKHNVMQKNHPKGNFPGDR